MKKVRRFPAVPLLGLGAAILAALLLWVIAPADDPPPAAAAVAVPAHHALTPQPLAELPAATGAAREAAAPSAAAQAAEPPAQPVPPALAASMTVLRILPEAGGYRAVVLDAASNRVQIVEAGDVIGGHPIVAVEANAVLMDDGKEVRQVPVQPLAVSAAPPAGQALGPFADENAGHHGY